MHRKYVAPCHIEQGWKESRFKEYYTYFLKSSNFFAIFFTYLKQTAVIKALKTMFNFSFFYHFFIIFI